MTFLIAGVAAFALVLGAIWAFARLPATTLARWVRLSPWIAGLGTGAFLSARGVGFIGLPLIALSGGMLRLLLAQPQTGGRSSGRAQAGARGADAPMTVAEACAVLGVSPNADETAIRRAYREAMKRDHPDAGGSEAEAQRVQAARDILLG